MLLIITILISILFYFCKESRDIFNSIESILAIPSLILSFIVLKVIDIKPENLDAYHRLRMMKDNEKEMRMTWRRLLMVEVWQRSFRKN